MFAALLAVRHADRAPHDAFTSVRYRNPWFSIDDDDRESKRTLGFLLLIIRAERRCYAGAGAGDHGAGEVTRRYSRFGNRLVFCRAASASSAKVSILTSRRSMSWT